ncbi:porin [Citrobacter koseri]|uniref:porin n=1 Tax=Citrobacter koseri TaxID=545 RepID=UPI001F28FEC8|nr:porin [Citrobacter koseri]
MKHKNMTVAILAVLASGSAGAAEIYNQDGNNLDLYGKVDGLHYFSSDNGLNGDQSYARLGVKGDTQINDEVSGYGQWEYNLQANNTEDTGGQAWTRLAFAGIRTVNNTLDYGRNYGVMYDVESMTDMLPEFGGDTYTQSDNYMTGRANGLATWRNSNFFGLVNNLNLALQYQGKNEGAGNGNEGTNNGRDLRNQNGEGWGSSLSYDTDLGLTAAVAYTTANRTIAQRNRGGDVQYANGKKAQGWSTGLKYDVGNMYVASTYGETLNMTPFGSLQSSAGGGIANKTRNSEITAQYQLDSGLRPSVSYLESRGKELGSSYGNNKSLVKYLDIGASWMLNKNMETYMDYKINLLNGNDRFYKDNNISTDNIIATGLVYQF